ncbi:MAG: DUF3048 domain-containing protein [Nocardioidaceae bacterium]|nr:DUF3048 domain-containing protein [Nocardioidaceae bacterium]
MLVRRGRRGRADQDWRRKSAVAELVLAVCAGAAACGGDKASGGSEPEVEAAAADRPIESVRTGGAVMLSGEWPLTGATFEGGGPQHPVYVVKMDNTASSTPQIGLSSADMVVEQLVEGGLTRLAVFYYSDVPDQVGPVRSLRASDIGIVKPTAAVLVASGGAGRTIARIADAEVATSVEGAAGFYRADDRSAPYDLFMSLGDLADNPQDGWQAPAESYLAFGDQSDFEGTIAVDKITATFSAAHSTEWKQTDDGWTRPESFAEEGDDFMADNVLLLKVKVGDAGYQDPAGNPVPETKFYGRGEAVLVHGGKALQATWSKESAGSALTLQNTDGDEVTVPAGRTWIELVPAEDGAVVLSS